MSGSLGFKTALKGVSVLDTPPVANLAVSTTACFKILPFRERERERSSAAHLY